MHSCGWHVLHNIETSFLYKSKYLEEKQWDPTQISISYFQIEWKKSYYSYCSFAYVDSNSSNMSYCLQTNGMGKAFHTIHQIQGKTRWNIFVHYTWHINAYMAKFIQFNNSILTQFVLIFSYHHLSVIYFHLCSPQILPALPHLFQHLQYLFLRFLKSILHFQHLVSHLRNFVRCVSEKRNRNQPKIK